MIAIEGTHGWSKFSAFELLLESGKFFSKLSRVFKNIAPWHDGFLSRFSFCQGQSLLVEQEVDSVSSVTLTVTVAGSCLT